MQGVKGAQWSAGGETAFCGAQKRKALWHHDRLSKLFRRVEMYRAALFISGTTALARQEPILLRPSKVPDVAECVKPPSAMMAKKDGEN